MKERPILFNGDMVRAILSGQKTQTRRIIKVQPESNEFGISRVVESSKKSDEGKYFWSISDETGFKKRSSLFNSPFGDIGDHLWVRETFAALDPGSYEQAKPMENHGQVIRYSSSQSDYVDPDVSGYRWKPSIHMPRWASRIQLEITDIRIQRLLDISRDDARAEGFTGEKPTCEFISTWRDIYGEADIDQNVWVWVIEFKRVES